MQPGIIKLKSCDYDENNCVSISQFFMQPGIIKLKSWDYDENNCVGNRQFLAIATWNNPGKPGKI